MNNLLPDVLFVGSNNIVPLDVELSFFFLELISFFEHHILESHRMHCTVCMQGPVCTQCKQCMQYTVSMHGTLCRQCTVRKQCTVFMQCPVFKKCTVCMQ